MFILIVYSFLHLLHVVGVEVSVLFPHLFTDRVQNLPAFIIKILCFAVCM